MYEGVHGRHFDLFVVSRAVIILMPDPLLKSERVFSASMSFDARWPNDS